MEDIKKVSIIFWEGYLDISPTVISLIEYLSEKKIQLSIFIRNDNQFDLSIIDSFDKKYVTTYQIQSLTNSLVIKAINSILRLINKITKPLLHHNNFINNFFSQLKSFIYIYNFSKKIKQINDNNFDITFCIDSIGLLTHKFSKMQSNKIVYISLEILNKKRNDWLNYIIKQNEILYLNTLIIYSIIQDKYRWDLFKLSNNYTIDNYLILPNTNRRTKSGIFIKNNYFHELFKLPSETIIVISAGLITEEVGSKGISSAISRHQFSKPTKIIFHSSLKKNEENNYLKEIKELGGPNLLLSLNPLPFNEINSIFSSADIGLVIYNKEANLNMSTIGHSSGKLFQFLKNGIPIVASNLSGLNELVQENQCGVIVQDYGDIPSAIETILNNYDYYSKNAKTAFNEKFDFDIYLENMYKILFSSHSN